jgi:hypothetical protein
MAMRLFTSEDEDEESQFIMAADGTYLHCQKSSNNLFQRMTYSNQKKTHLVKPFVICATNGYIVDVYGLYPANQNDTSILEEILEEDPEIHSLLQRGDIFLLDRGFRNVRDYLATNGFVAKCPAFVPTTQKQLTTIEANQTRLVTKCRYVVEVTNAFLKTCFRALDKTVPNQSLLHYLDDFRIAAALINKYHSRIYSDGENSVDMADKMLAKVNEENQLETIIQQHKLNRLSQFEKMTADQIKDFPRLTLEQIKQEITFGQYQLKQALSYISEHLSETGRYEISNIKSEKKFL